MKNQIVRTVLGITLWVLTAAAFAAIIIADGSDPVDPVPEGPGRGVGRRMEETAEADEYLCGADAVCERSSVRIYCETDDDLPDWWDPNGPMAAEWTVADGATDIFAGDTDVLIKDIGCPDYNVELEVIPGWLLDVPLDWGLQEYIHGLCEDSGLPYTLAVAVVEQESSYIPWAISETGDYGLMQINTICLEWLAGELGITDFLDPYQCALAGVYLLSGYYEKYEGFESAALMAYNMGEAGANRLFEQGIYSTAYSERVLGIKYRLDNEGR